MRLADALALHEWMEARRLPLPNLAGAVMVLLAAEWGEERARRVLRDFAGAVYLPPQPRGFVP